MKKTIWIYQLIFLSLLISCSKDVLDNNDVDGQEAFATIMDAGVGAADGCGWMVVIGTDYYHPENLAPEFQISGTEVYIRYSLTNEIFYCGIASLPYPTIKIKDIFQQSRSCLPIHSYNSTQYFYQKDALTINDVEIISDCLQISLSYSGGCKTHEFLLFQDISKSDLTFQFSHNANDDPCEAWITTTLSYDLFPFQNPDSSSISFYLEAPSFKKYLKYNY